MPLNIFEPRVKFPTFLICPAAPSGPETLQQLVSAAVTLVTRAVNVPSQIFKVPGEGPSTYSTSAFTIKNLLRDQDTILNRRLNQVKYRRLSAKIITAVLNKPPVGYDLCVGTRQCETSRRIDDSSTGHLALHANTRRLIDWGFNANITNCHLKCY